MKKLFILSLLVSVFSSVAYTQEYNYSDDDIVVSLVESDGEDVRCSLFSSESGNLQDAIDNLIKEGRYLKSVTNTRFGVLVVHKPNTKNIQQMFTIIPDYRLEKDIKKYFKEGWSILYYNTQRDYALFDRNPEITRQTHVKKKFDRKKNNDQIAKYNAKGEYITIVSISDLFAQDGHGSNIEQCYQGFYDKFKEHDIAKYINEGWFVSSVAKFYSRYGDSNSYYIIFDKQKGSNIKQKILFLSTKGGVDEFKKSIEEGYRIDNIWCGWENKDWAKLDADLESYRNRKSSTSEWLDIIGGITSGVGQLFGGNSNSSSSTVDGSDETYDSSGAGSSNVSRKKSTSKSNHANWRSLEQSYSNYESQLIRMSNSSNIDKQEVRSIQRKMRDIREKIRVQSGGHQRATSQWENWNP